MKEWAPKDWCFLTVVLEKTLESPLDSKDIKPVNPKGNQPWIFIGRTDVEKDWRQKEKGTKEDKMVGWDHQLNGHEFEKTPGDSEGKGSLECWSPWGHKEPDTAEWLNNNSQMWRPHSVIQPSHTLSSPFPFVFNLPQDQDLLQWVNYSHQMAKYWSFSFSINSSKKH